MSTTDRYAGREIDLSEPWNVNDLQAEINRLDAQLAADRERWLAAIAERLCGRCWINVRSEDFGNGMRAA